MLKSIIKITLIFILLFFQKVSYAQLEYPKTAKKEVVNTYHGTEVKDEYQWLEQSGDKRVDDWIKEQNRIATGYLRKTVRSLRIEGEMDRYMFSDVGGSGEEIDDRIFKNKYYYRIMYPGVSSSPAVYFKKGTKGSYERLISGDLISKKDFIYINNYKPSRGDDFLAYQYSRNGSDRNEIKIVGIKKRKFFKEILKDTYSTGIFWKGQGFFYTKFPYDASSGKAALPRVMYHKLDTDQKEDKLVFEGENVGEYIRLFGSRKEDFYILKKEDSKKKTFSYYYVSDNKLSLEFKPLLLDIKYDLAILKYDNGTVFVQTIFNNRKQLISFPADAPKKWRVLSPKYAGAVLTDYEFVNDNIFLTYHTQKNGFITSIDHQGTVLNELKLPDGLSVRGLSFVREFNKLYFTMQSYTIPPVQCKFDLEEFTYEITDKTGVNFDYKKYKFIQEEFVSHDGVKVPIFIVFKDSISRNSNTPFLMKAYGGYGTIGLPSFDPGIIYFLENGGAFAYVNVRGGGLLGQKWREEGRKLKKTNAIYDFVHGAEFLVKQGYTKPKKIAAMGSSHGGLVIASSVLKKPSLFGAAVVNVGVLDMLRFENFTIGTTTLNLNEFGSVKNEIDFKNLYSYSPYHNIKNTINYPSILIVTGTDDDRVSPLHSFKFAARMQANPAQKNPIILWTQKNAGHFGARKIYDRLKENNFKYGFLFNELSKN